MDVYICQRSNVMKPDTVRTNIVLDSKLIEAGLKATGLKTRRELVDFALRELLRHKQQKKLLSLKGKVSWAADIYRKLRKQGITMRKTNECIIAATALEHQCQLLHKDKDFAPMAKNYPLKVVKP